MPGEDNYDDELVSGNPNQRNWRGILIALLVIIIVLALIVTSVILLTPPDEGPRVKGQRIKLQDIVDGHFLPQAVNGSWISANEFVYQDQWGGISLLNVGNLSYQVLMSNTTFRTISPYKFSISPDKRYLLLSLNVQKLFRHSYLAQYLVFDIQTSETFKLSTKTAGDEWPYLHYVRWTEPGHAIVMIYNYDVYYTQGPRSNQVYRISKDGVPGIIYNGIPDWLYEEEILGTNEAIWMSSDGHLMLYGSFNDSMVQEQKFAWFGTIVTESGNSYLYPEIRSLRYPKPGTLNPTITLRVADLADLKNIRIKSLRPPSALFNEDHYFTDAKWISLTEICVIWMNRPQNLSIVTICKSPTFQCVEVHRTTGDNKGWVDIMSVPLFASNASSYITVSPIRDGASGYFRHLIHLQIAQKRIIPLTHGRFEIKELLHWDQINNYIYYLGSPERMPSQQHLYRVSAIPPKYGAPLKQPECLTCPLTEDGRWMITTKAPPRLVTAWDDDWEEEEVETLTLPPPTPPTGKKKKKKPALSLGPQPCLYHTASFPPGLDVKYVFIECLGPMIPTSAIYSIVPTDTKTHNKAPLQMLITIQNNTKLRNKISKTALPQIKTFPVMISGGYHAQVKLLLPPGLREDEITRYPAILHVYSGPGTQLVTDKWHVDWNTYLSSTKDYIIIQIDGRGSSGQGYQLLHEVYKRLGSVEVSDQLEVTEYLRDNLHFIDGRRMGVWGWSYGGYTAALVLASAQSIFQCGISVAPVTNWKLYDSTYSERYLSFPNVTDNYKGYEEGDLTKYIDNLRDKQYLLVHGTADDNVHFQQSMLLARALTSKGVLFKQQIYPDEGHSLSGVKRHLYRSMTEFFEDCFRKLVPPELKAGLGNGGTGDQ